MNYKVVIDAGHGGSDPGASGNGIIEKDLTLQISQYMSQRLSELGVQNSMTRTGDETLAPADRTKKIQSFYGTGNNVIVVSNHLNAGGGDGAEVIYALRNNDRLSSIIAGEFLKTPQNFRKYFQRRLPSDSSKDYYYMMRDTPNNETIIVEYGFLDSKGDDVTLLKNNWNELTEAVVKALAEYMGIKYVPPMGESIEGDEFYTVKVGDTLWNIAKQFNMSVEQLKSLNNMTTNMLTVGQTLKVKQPSTPSTSSKNTYTVKAGDSLYSIAREFNMSVEQLKALNNLTSNNLSIGQILKISEPTPGESTGETYTVNAGDSLYAIARQFNMSVEQLKALNNLVNDNLSIGQILTVSAPSGNTSYINYTVKAGDSLYRIAAAYNTTVDTITQANNLTTSALSIGQILKIPTNGTTTEIIHTVLPGESLYSISNKYNTTVQNIINMNNLINDLLSIGQKLKIA